MAMEANEQIVLPHLAGKTVFITGATGLIGQNLVHALASNNNRSDVPAKIIVLVRSLDRAKNVLKNDYNAVKCIVGDVTKPVSLSGPVDYIIHAASQTSSKAFIEHPIDTIDTAFAGTKNILELAKEKNVKKFVYLSTMEIYGSPYSDEKINEFHGTNLDTMLVRSCYPESKRLCENLCIAYMREFGVPVNVIRLTQTFGEGVSYNDGRVFAEFARCVIEEKNIILHTKGETKRNYLYTQDAVNAILTVLIKGEAGQAYNAANEDTYCSIYEMAQMVAKKFADGKVNVKVEIQDESKFGFAPTLKMNLDTAKLKSLGWKPRVGLEDMFAYLIDDMRAQKNENRNNKS